MLSSYYEVLSTYYEVQSPVSLVSLTSETAMTNSWHGSWPSIYMPPGWNLVVTRIELCAPTHMWDKDTWTRLYSVHCTLHTAELGLLTKSEV